MCIKNQARPPPLLPVQEYQTTKKFPNKEEDNEKESKKYI